MENKSKIANTLLVLENPKSTEEEIIVAKKVYSKERLRLAPKKKHKK